MNARSRVHPLVFAVVLMQVLVPIVLLRQHGLRSGSFAHGSDSARYFTLAHASGTPYRSFPAEYPPIALAMFKAIGGSAAGFVQRLIVLNAVAQAIIVVTLLRVWGRRAALSYLFLSAPMLFDAYLVYDLVVIAVAVVGAALIRRRRATAGALALVVGAFMKVWPGALLPLVAARGRVRSAIIGVAAALAGLFAWVAWSGRDGPGQVLTYRSAHGWEFESVPGSLLRFVTHDKLFFESGAWRVGEAPGMATLLPLVIAAAVIVWVYLSAARLAVPDGVAETAVVAALLVGATLLSSHFVAWLLPWAAIAGSWGVRSIERCAGAVAVLTFLTWLAFNGHPSDGRVELLLLTRNAALVGLLVAALRNVWAARAPIGAATVQTVGI